MRATSVGSADTDAASSQPYLTSLSRLTRCGVPANAAYEFLYFLAGARKGVWEGLPVNPPANGNWRYSSTSAFAGNPQLVSLERLVKYGWLDAASVSALPTEVARIDYEQVNRDKLPLLWQAARNFLERTNGDARQRFDDFCEGNSWWLEDYVLFDTLRERHRRNWCQ